MKLTAVVLFTACLSAAAKGHSQNITLSLSNAPLEKVFDQFKQQTGYSFFWDEETLKGTHAVTITLNNATLQQAMDACVKGQPISYSILQNMVVLKAVAITKGVDDQPFAIAALISIHGRVVNENGSPVGGVSVQVKGSNNKGTTTNANGEFTLMNVDETATLVFTGTNIETFEQKVNGKTELGSLSSVTKVTSLQDVTVSKGYYSVKQRENTGNVTVVDAKILEQQPVTDLTQALIGRVAGLNIQQGSGEPGTYATIRLRGVNSIANGSDPLYIIDGVPFSSTSLSSPNLNFGPGGTGTTNNFSGPGTTPITTGISPFSAINMDDIESIEVLKDADATAIYGSRGANGVILITTKKGKKENAKFSLDLQQGFSRAPQSYHMLNTQQYLMMRKEAFKNDGLALPDINVNPGDYNYDINGTWDTTRYTNWQKVFLGNTAEFTNAQGTLSGGSDNTQFLLSFNYNRQGTVILGPYYDEKVSGHSSITHTSPNKKLNVLFSMSYMNDKNTFGSNGAYGIWALPPDAPAMYDQNGHINWEVHNGTATFTNNPAANFLGGVKSITDNLITGLNLSYHVFNNTEIKCVVGYNHDEMNQTSLGPADDLYPPYTGLSSVRSSTFSTTTRSTWNVEPQVNYHKKIGAGKLNALVGSTLLQRINNTLSYSASGFVSDALIGNPVFASAIRIYGANYTQYKYLSFYGQADYGWNNKYYVNATVRRDGSSRFGPGKQFGNFGAIGAAWIFGDEKFFHDKLPFLSFGKLHASYGTTGNDQIADYQYLSSYSSLGTAVYQGITGLIPSSLANADFAWEVVKKMELGIDLNFLHDRINFLGSFYRHRSTNQLVGYSLPTTTGFTSVQFNLPAKVQNAGVEMALNTVNIKTRNFSWQTNINFTRPENKLVAFPNIGNFASYKNSLVIGKSLFIRKAAVMTGVNPQTGLYTLATVSGNGIPLPNEYTITPPVTQKYYGGITNSFSYKTWTLDIFIHYVNQLAGYSYRVQGNMPGANGTNQPTEVLKRWQKPGDQTSIQRFGNYGGGPATNAYIYWSAFASDITDASFLRLQNVALSYQVPSGWRKKMHLQSMRIYVQAQNLLTVTKYQVFDPEIQSYSLPPLRTIVFGLQTTF